MASTEIVTSLDLELKNSRENLVAGLGETNSPVYFKHMKSWFSKQQPNMPMDGNGLMEQNGSVLSNGEPDNQSRHSTPSEPDYQSGHSTISSNKLFIGGLHRNTTVDKMREYFGQFGDVTDVLLVKEPVTQRSRGFGFVTFTDPSCVEKVLKVPKHTLDGKKIDPKYATPKNRVTSLRITKKVFVGGVTQDTTVDELKTYFSKFGIVEDTVMLMDQQTKRHRGFGFVTFEDEEVMDQVCKIHYHTINKKKVECKIAQPKDAVLHPPLIDPAAVIAAAYMPQTQYASVPNAASEFFGRYPQLPGIRYAPYPMPPMNTAMAPPITPAGLYHGYNFGNVDMSSFQGINWSALYQYGAGIYVQK